MDWLTLVSELTRSLAWPVAVIVLVFFLRTPLGKLILQLKRVKYGDAEAEFDQESKELKAQAKGIKAPPAPGNGVKPLSEDQPSPPGSTAKTDPFAPWRPFFQRLSDPLSLVMESWGSVESEIREIAKDNGINPSEPFPVIADELAKRQAWDPQQARILFRLYRMRNLAVHDGVAVKFEDAAPYAAVAASFFDYLESLRTKN